MGLTISVGFWVIDGALNAFAGWCKSHKGDPGILSINISPIQLVCEGFAEQFNQKLKALDLNAANIELEVTESALMLYPSAIEDCLHALTDLGVEIAIDDFGTGYSSLSRLSTMPVSTLKIDQSFIQNMQGNPSNVAIVKSIITLAEHLNLRVIAEGAETQEQIDMLHENGCQYVQGFYYSKAISFD